MSPDNNYTIHFYNNLVYNLQYSFPDVLDLEN